MSQLKDFGTSGASATWWRQSRTWLDRLSLLAVIGIAVLLLLPPVIHDFRDNLPYGDQTAHLLSGLSLAYDSHTLNLDGTDSQRWRDLGWIPQPEYTFFQHYDDGWAAAKPYGYPLALAPLIAMLGPVLGVALANTLILGVMMLIATVLLWRRFTPITAALVVAAFFLAGYFYMYAYPVQVELFLALLVMIAFGAAYLYRTTGATGWAFVAVAAMASGVAEKSSFVLLFAPLAAVVLWEARRPRRVLALLATGVGVLALAVFPYLVYSDWHSVTPYGGDRYQLKAGAGVRPPWEGGKVNVDYLPAAAEEEAFLANATSGGVGDKLQSLAYYVVGRYTGLLVTLPFALLVLIVSLARVRSMDRWSIAVLAGILAYIAFYVVVFTGNYYGGGQSLGNRYFIQIAPAVLVLVLLIPLRERAIRWIAVGAIALSALLTLPHHIAPDVAYIDILETSAPQRLLPVEANQDYTWIFRQEPPPSP